MLIENLKIYIGEHPTLTPLYLIIAKIVGAILFFPGTPLTLLAGATLGTFYGSIISVIGNTIGAVAAFLISRFLLKDYVQKNIITKYKGIDKYEKRLTNNGLVTVIILRLIPLFPFNALNYILGVTRVSNRDYIIGTFVGIIPGTIAFVYFGEAIRMLSVYNIIMAIVIIITLTVLGKKYNKSYEVNK